jgi:DNA-binding response OmpR family regulator
LLTAKSNIESRLEGLKSGADDYVAKPFHFKLLEARIQNLIDLRKKLFALFTSKTELDPNEITTNPIDEQFIQKAIKLIEMNIGNPDFGVSELILEFNMSRSS